MTGFTAALRRLCLLGPPRKRWTEVEDASEDECTPARLKLSVRNRQQFEIKVTYQLDPALKEQRYRLEAFIFLSPQLLSSSLDFYSNLYSTIRLHTPHALLSDLCDTHPGALLAQLAAELQALLPSPEAKGHPTPAELASRAASVVQLLRLFCEAVRRSLRPETKALHGQLKAARQQPSGGSALQDASRGVMLLVQSLTDAIDAVQEVCECCESADAPAAVSQAWALCKEFLLCEADRSLMKLLFDFQLLEQPQPAAAAGAAAAAAPAAATVPEDESGAVIEIQLPVRQSAALHSSVTIPVTSHLPPISPFLSFKSGLTPAGSSAAAPDAGEADPERTQAGVRLGSRALSRRLGPRHRSLLPQEAWAVIERYTTTVGGAAPAAAHPVSGSGSALAADAEARAMLALAIDKLQGARQAAGFSESIIALDSPNGNEAYTHRVKVLKGSVQAAVSLRLQSQAPSTVLADCVGMAFAAAAMGVAILFLWIADRYGGGKYGTLYVLILVGSYVLKDRIKEWGKRYLQPLAEWFGLRFPDTIENFVDSTGAKVGQSRQNFAVKADTDVDARVREMRWRHSPAAAQRAAAAPERVCVHVKRVRVAWTQLNARLRGVTGLDDVMRLDLQHLCRRMAPALEAHHWVDGGGRVVRVQCARVHHLNLVLRVKCGPGGEGGSGGGGSGSMRMESARLVVNREGILRLEPLGSLPLLHKAA